MERRAVIILNPVAGKKKGKTMLFDVCSMLSELSFEPLVYLTKGRGDATEAAKRFADECDLMVVVGGDGTLNETISGLIGCEKKPPLCYLATGTTNDFATTLGIPKDLEETALAVREASLFPVDVGRFDERYFTYIASFGIFTKASYSADQTAKNLLGHFAYVLEGAKEITDLGKAYRVRVNCDGQTIEGEYIFGSVTNTTMMGGLFPLPPQRVSLNDGLFEVMLVRAPKNLNDVAKDYSMMKNGTFDGEHIVFLQGRDVTIESEEEIAWCTDGEFAGNRCAVRCENLHRAVEVYVKKD